MIKRVLFGVCVRAGIWAIAGMTVREIEHALRVHGRLSLSQSKALSGAALRSGFGRRLPSRKVTYG